VLRILVSLFRVTRGGLRSKTHQPRAGTRPSARAVSQILHHALERTMEPLVSDRIARIRDLCAILEAARPDDFANITLHAEIAT